MNERIKDLALEAIVENISSDLWVFNDAELEKFAQLIVQECADLCSKYGDRVEYNRPNSGYEAWECADIIKQHFGVEK